MSIAESIQSLTELGLTPAKIAARLNLKTDDVLSSIKQGDFRLLKELAPSTDRLAEIYNAGVSLNRLVDKTGMQRDHLEAALRSQGAVLRGRADAARLKPLNYNFFDIIDSKDKAFLLGFLSETGCLNHNPYALSVRLRERHLKHLELLSSHLSSPIETVEKKKWTSYHLSAHSKHLVRTLEDRLDGHFPIYLNDDFQLSFVRGLIEATTDGKNVLIETEEPLLEEVASFLRQTYKLPLEIQGTKIMISDEAAISIILGKEIKNTTQPSNNKFTDIAIINGIEITRKHLQSLSLEERKTLVEPLFQHFREQGWQYPNLTQDEVNKEYQRLLSCNIDINKLSISNNSTIGTGLCKFFCAKSFYDAHEEGYEMPIVCFNNDDKLRKVIENRLGLTWFDLRPKEVYEMHHKALVNGFRQSRQGSLVSIFKPEIAKYMALRYSNEGDTIGDYSCGFGGRLLGAASCGRKYIGTDPLTVPELKNMVSCFGLKDCKLIQDGSENYRGKENSIDLYWSSPPYFRQEIYSIDKSQANANGEDYFFGVYWRKTIANVQFMLKPGKWFGLNVKNDKMLQMAEQVFGKIIEKVELVSSKSPQTTKNHNETKSEFIFMFRNEKKR